MEVKLTIPDDLASRLNLTASELPRIIELGLRELNSQPNGFEGLSDVLEAFARLPTPAEVLALRASPALQSRVEELLEKNRAAGLSAEEQREWDRYEYVEHLVRVAKAQAAVKLAAS